MAKLRYVLSASLGKLALLGQTCVQREVLSGEVPPASMRCY